MNYAETASSSTIVPLPLVPSQSQCQQDTASYVSSVASYVIGPIDPAQLIPMQAHCTNGEHCPLLVPKSLLLWILNHPAFRDGYEQNYMSEEEGENEEWGTVSRMVNLIYSNLLGEGFEDPDTGGVDAEFGAWEIGWLLRDFTRLAETDGTRALTGMAHLCFLGSFLPADPPASWPPVVLVDARSKHDRAVKAFRACIRVYREQGKSYDEAQRFALCPFPIDRRDERD